MHACASALWRSEERTAMAVNSQDSMDCQRADRPYKQRPRCSHSCHGCDGLRTCLDQIMPFNVRSQPQSISPTACSNCE